MSVIVDFAVFPTDQGGSVGRHVARAVKIVRDSGLACRTHAMGTEIEGEFEEVMALVARCFEAVCRDSDRVYMTLAADYRRGRAGGLEGKLKSVEEKL